MQYWVKALEIASGIKTPVAALVFMGVIAAFLSVWLWNRSPVLALLVATVFLAYGLAPLIASVFLAHEGIYHVQIVTLDVSGRPTSDAEINASIGVLTKREHLNWEVDIFPQMRPIDGKVTFFASDKNSYLAGNSMIVLADNYFPQVKIHLKPLPSVILRGVVVRPDGSSISGAKVSIVGYSEQASTDEMGNFALPSHAADGQVVTIRAEKGKLAAQYSGPAGKPFMVTMRKQ